MDKLISRLNSIPNAYFEFVDSVVDYAEINEAHLQILLRFLDEHDLATPSDIIEFISSQPDFYDDDAPIDVNILVGWIELRESTGMNRKHFCDYFEIPYMTVSAWEHGNRRIPAYFLKLLDYYVKNKKLDTMNKKQSKDYGVN